MNINKHIIVIILSLTTFACSSTVIIPDTGNRKTVISHANTSNEVMKKASYKAKRICMLQEKTLQIVELDTKYQGIDKEQQALLNKAKMLLPRNKTSGDFVPSKFKYTCDLTFRCI